MTPTVSAIIPTWNRRAMVREAIASVVAQRGIDYELIIVDDGSTDGTAEELAELAATGAYRVIRAMHEGAPAARNRGVKAAAGEFVAFLDSDDLWMPDRLMRQIAFMRKYPRLCVAQCGERWLRAGRTVNPGRRHRKRGGDFFVESLRTCLVSLSATIMRRDFFCAIGGFDESLTACEDYDLWLRVLLETDIGLLDEPLVTRRAGHRDQLSVSVPALDRFRILALMKILAAPHLTPARRAAACEVLVEKCAIYRKGLARRRRPAAALLCDTIARAAAGWRDAADYRLIDLVAMMRSVIQSEHARDSSPMHEAR